MAARVRTTAPLLRFLGEILRQAKADGIGHRAAALAFFALFAMPGVLLVVAWALRPVRDEVTRGDVVANVRSWAGPDAADVVRDVLAHAEPPHAYALGPWLATVTLLFGASGFFLQLQDALNAMWGVAPGSVPRRRRIAALVLRQLLSFGLVLALAVLVLASLAASTLLSAFGDGLAFHLGIAGGATVVTLANEAVSCALIAVLLAGIYRVVPHVKMGWPEIRLGALATAVLFVAAKLGMGVYLAGTEPGSVFGVAGPLAVVLIWAYASTLLVLLGAELIQVLERRRVAVLRRGDPTAVQADPRDQPPA